MQVLLEEAKDSYKEEIITVRPSDTTENLLETVEQIQNFVNNFK